MANETFTLNDLAHFLQKYWYDWTGLAAALVVATTAAETLLVSSKAVWWLNILILVLVLLIITVAWWLSMRPPKTPRDKVGFLVSITCNDDVESAKVREDFLIPLQKLIKSGASGSAFHFMQLRPHLANQLVDSDEAQFIRIKTGAHFMLYGQVRLRVIDGKEHHIIELDGLVAHKEIPEHLKKQLSGEFSELLPRRLSIDTKNDLFSFQFTSEWAHIVAKYIIGIAAAISGEPDYAEALFNDAKTSLAGKDQAFPIYQKLATRIPLRISELYEARAIAAFRAWSKEHTTSHRDRMCSYLSKIPEGNQYTTLRVLTLRAIAVFLLDRDTKKSISYLKRIKNKNHDGVWHYNLAFLQGYQGDLKAAARSYNQAARHHVEPGLIGELEDFICWVLRQEPDRYQLYYCLGLFNRKAKGDAVQASKDFETFLKEADAEKYPKEIELAQKWISELGG